MNVYGYVIAITVEIQHIFITLQSLLISYILLSKLFIEVEHRCRKKAQNLLEFSQNVSIIQIKK